MNNYYVTYGNNTKQAHCFSVVQGTSLKDARETVREKIDFKWAFIYPEGEWKESRQQERFGLTEIPLQAHELKV